MTFTDSQRQFDPTLVSMVVAHGITPRVVATWSPVIHRAPRVLVPIALDVLVVRDPNQAWAQCAMQQPPPTDGTTGDHKTVEAQGLMPTPFSDLPPGTRKRGAYLHWYLPNALTSGISDTAANTATFPPIPDRWLVLRISTGKSDGRRAVSGWVLDSGDLTPKVTPLDQWIEHGTPPDVEKPLTALGHGDLSWAGYFDNVENRLGFFDATLDAVTGPLAYVVCGWYADPSADPLGDARITTAAAFDAKLQELGWHVDQSELDSIHRQTTGYVNAALNLGLQTSSARTSAAQSPRPSADPSGGKWWPQAVLLHGAVVGISWPAGTSAAEVGGPPPAASISVGVGNSTAEAIATLVARANNAPQEAAIIEALQLGVIRELEQPDGRAELDIALHASSFASLSGGSPTLEPVDIAPSGPPPAPPANPPPPKPGVFGTPASMVSSTVNFGNFARFDTAATAQHNFGVSREAIFSSSKIGEANVRTGVSRASRAEQFVLTGGMAEVIKGLSFGSEMPVSDPGGPIQARRARPRFYTPRDPIVLIKGAKRAFVHDSSVHTDDGMLNCRLTPVNELSWLMPGTGQRLSVKGEDVLERGVENGSVPNECEGILNETVLLDPGSASTAATSAAAAIGPGDATNALVLAFDRNAAQQNIMVEQTAWWALRDPRVDHAPLLAQSGLAGTLPAAFAVAPASQPWTPMHLDWAVEFVRSPKGVDDWSLDEIDFSLDSSAAVPPAGGGVRFEGRAVLAAGASTTLAASVRNTLTQVASIGGTGAVHPTAREAFYSPLAAQLTGTLSNLTLGPTWDGSNAESSGVNRSLLDDIATQLEQMDVLSCGLDGLLEKLRGGIAPDGVSALKDGTVPPQFVALRAGFLRIVRLRLVDGFGQYVNLCGSDATHPAHDIVVSDALSVTQQNAVVPDVIGLPPRFTAPTRLWFRYMSAATPDKEADHETSPVCAFVMPNHLDGALEFFNADGSSAGNLYSRGDGRVHWEDTPGSVTAAGQDPARALSNPFAAQFARSLIDWGVADMGRSNEAALAALLRTIDTTLWTVDPCGHKGDEHLSLLMGHPVCVMRAMLRLEVADPVVTPDGTVVPVPIELGNLTHWQDGLLGYFVNDDYSVLYTATAAAEMARQCGPQQGFLQQINLVPQYYADFSADLVAGAAASPVTHPYVNSSGRIFVRPNQTVMLTLLVEPLSVVHATAGLVPRKDIGMRRNWVNDGLAKIAPTFRFGPVLVDPQQIRMPLAAELNGAWVWDYRADAVKWKEDNVTNATDNALLAPDPPTAMEGWLRLTPPPPPSSGSG